MRDDDGTNPDAQTPAPDEGVDAARPRSADGPGDGPAVDGPDFELPDGEIAALSSALDDAFDETFSGLDGPDPSERREAGDAQQTAAASLSASAKAIDGTDQMLRETRQMMAASIDAMHGALERPDGAPADDLQGGEASAGADPELDSELDSELQLDDAEAHAAADDAEQRAAGRSPATRAALLTGSGTETVDLEDADDDLAADLPSRPPDSLVGAIPWDEDGRRGPLRIAVAGGRGGAGRTLLVANTALVLARLGRRCSVVDLDPVGAGLHTALGLPPLLTGPAALLDPPPCEAEPVPGVPLSLLRPRRPALSGPGDPLRAECLAAGHDREDDVLLLDLGAQADPFTLDVWLEADVSVVVAEPLPAAIERAYGFLRAALWRRLLHRRGETEAGPTALARRIISEQPEIDSPAGLVRALSAVDADAARAIRARVLTFTPRLLMNRTRNRVDREMGPAMVSALRRRWGVTAEFVGSIDFDEAVREAARRRRPLLLAYPGAGYSQAIEKVARTLDRLAEARGGRP